MENSPVKMETTGEWTRPPTQLQRRKKLKRIENINVYIFSKTTLTHYLSPGIDAKAIVQATLSAKLKNDQIHEGHDSSSSGRPHYVSSSHGVDRRSEKPKPIKEGKEDEGNSCTMLQ